MLGEGSDIVKEYIALQESGAKPMSHQGKESVTAKPNCQLTTVFEQCKNSR